MTSSILKLELPDEKTGGKMELLSLCRELMPQGKPKFSQVVKFEKISDLVKTAGFETMHKLLFLLVKDFCAGVNVVRNMNEEQMIETAAMLLDECGNFRIEDYLMMFQMGKRGELLKIYDRLDISVITEMLNAYWLKRNRAAESYMDEQANRFDSIGATARVMDGREQDAKTIAQLATVSESLHDMKIRFNELKTKSNEQD